MGAAWAYEPGPCPVCHGEPWGKLRDTSLSLYQFTGATEAESNKIVDQFFSNDLAALAYAISGGCWSAVHVVSGRQVLPPDLIEENRAKYQRQ